MASRIGLKKLAAFSRQLATMLEAGLPIRRALSVMEKGARASQKTLYHRLGLAIESGLSFTDALEREGRAFPPLFVHLSRVGETVGGLDRVLKSLADYYEFVRSMWMRFLTRLIYPLLQFWALIFILAGLAYIRSMILPGGDGSPRQAYMTLGIGVLIFTAPIVLYLIGTRLLGGGRVVHEMLMRVPIIGNVMRALSLARFSWSMELMTDAGVNIVNAIAWSAQATANQAFVGRSAGIVQRVKEGDPLHKSLQLSGLFPEEYIEMVNVSEESGSMPEMFGRLAKMYFEKADTAIRALTTALGWLIWAGVAGAIIYNIFKLYGQVYGEYFRAAE
jgi:type IV pilus assembly protein PilC